MRSMNRLSLLLLLTVLSVPASVSAQEDPAPPPPASQEQAPPGEPPSTPPDDDPDGPTVLFGFSPEQGQDVYLSTRQGVDRINIAMPRPSGTVEWAETAERLIEIARSDLHFSGMFRTVDPALYSLVQNDIAEGEPASVTARRWQSIGAAYLLRSHIDGEEDQIVLEAYLVDLASGDEVMGKRYTTTLDKERRLSHHLADDIVSYFTGSRSVFTTHVIYASRRGDSQEIYIADYDGANERALTQNGSLNLSPSVSSDGTLAAFTSFVTGGPRLHLAEVRSGQSRPLWDCPGTCQSPAWDPKGEKLAFSQSVGGNAEIFLVERDGGEASRLTDHRAIDVSPTWSPAGSEIAFVSDRAGTPQIYAMDQYGLNVRRLTYVFEQATEPAWSPKGDKIAFTGRHQRRNRICLLDLASKEESCFPPIGSDEESPSWSPNGNYLSFLVNRGGSTMMYMRRADGVGDATPVFLRGDPKTAEWFR